LQTYLCFIKISRHPAIIDRKATECDYKINIGVELEIDLLHQKIDQFRETEALELSKAVADDPFVA